MKEILAELTRHPIRTRLALTGPMIVARDLAHAKIRERLDRGEPMPDYLKNHPVYYAGPAKTPEGMASGSFGPTTAGRMDSFVDQFQAAGGSMVMLAKGNRSAAVREACAEARRLLPRLDRRAGRAARAGLHQEGRGARISRARHGGRVADRGRELPGLHRRRRQGQRLLQGAEPRLRGAEPGGGGPLGWRRPVAGRGRGQRLDAAGSRGVGGQAVVADVARAARQDVDEKASDGLGDVEGQGLERVACAASRVSARAGRKVRGTSGVIGAARGPNDRRSASVTRRAKLPGVVLGRRRRRVGLDRRRGAINDLIGFGARRGWSSSVWRHGRRLSNACLVDLLRRRPHRTFGCRRRRAGLNRRRGAIAALVGCGARRGWRSGAWRRGGGFSNACRGDLLSAGPNTSFRRRRPGCLHRRGGATSAWIRRSARVGWRSGVWRRAIFNACRLRMPR